MAPANWQEWIAWAGLALPLISLAWAACFFVLTRRREVHHQEFQRVFEVMDHLGQQGGSIASKMAAAYELRKYPEYREVIIRLCENVELQGSSAAIEMMREELRLTAEYMKAQR
jgi:hypothetical protein